MFPHHDGATPAPRHPGNDRAKIRQPAHRPSSHRVSRLRLRRRRGARRRRWPRGARGRPVRAPAVPAGWRIVAAFPPGSSVDELAASGPGSAWAVESCRKPCRSGNGVILRHWNGKAWQPQAQPAVSRHAGDDEPQLAIAPGSKDVWAVYNLYDGKLRASAAEWTGKSWGKATLFPAGVSFTSVVAASPSDVWGFGLDNSRVAQYTAHFNGTAWSEVSAPGRALGQWIASARSPSDIWAQSISAKGFSLAVSRWNGKRWVKQAVPAALKAADGTTANSIAVSGRSGVWGYGYFGTTPRTAGTASGIGWLVHFDGTSWSTVRIPYLLSQNIMAGPLGADGRGGAWIAATPASSGTESLYHVSAAGHWLKRPIPAPKGAHGTTITDFAPIPGSTSVYAYGAATTSGGQSEGVILRYGA